LLVTGFVQKGTLLKMYLVFCTYRFFDTEKRVINPKYHLKQDKQKGIGRVYVTGGVYCLIYIKYETM